MEEEQSEICIEEYKESMASVISFPDKISGIKKCIVALEEEIRLIETGKADNFLYYLGSYNVPEEFKEVCGDIKLPPPLYTVCSNSQMAYQMNIAYSIGNSKTLDSKSRSDLNYTYGSYGASPNQLHYSNNSNLCSLPQNNVYLKKTNENVDKMDTDRKFDADQSVKIPDQSSYVSSSHPYVNYSSISNPSMMKYGNSSPPSGSSNQFYNYNNKMYVSVDPAYAIKSATTNATRNKQLENLSHFSNPEQSSPSSTTASVATLSSPYLMGRHSNLSSYSSNSPTSLSASSSKASPSAVSSMNILPSSTVTPTLLSSNSIQAPILATNSNPTSSSSSSPSSTSSVAPSQSGLSAGPAAAQGSSLPTSQLYYNLSSIHGNSYLNNSQLTPNNSAFAVFPEFHQMEDGTTASGKSNCNVPSLNHLASSSTSFGGPGAPCALPSLGYATGGGIPSAMSSSNPSGSLTTPFSVTSSSTTDSFASNGQAGSKRSRENEPRRSKRLKDDIIS